MTQENFERVLRAFLARRPFRPFTLELASGGRIEVNHPEAVQLYANGLITVASTTQTRSVFEAGVVIRFLTATGIT